MTSKTVIGKNNQVFEKRSCIFILDVLIYLGIMNAHAPIAQLDRVTGYEPVGRGFESLSAYQTVQIRTFYQLVKGSDLLFILHILIKVWLARFYGN